MMRTFLHRLTRALSCRRGVFAAEYAVLAVGVIVVVASAAVGFSGTLTNAMSNVGTNVRSTQTSLAAR